MAGKQYHLWRKYKDAPYVRWACCVEQADTPDGYRVVDHDSKVADVQFLQAMLDTLTSDQPVYDSITEGDMTIETIEFQAPGSPGHFGSAIRKVPNAVLRPGRTA
jgi:hypothetical protein